jgi:hypothetical protein
MLAAALVLEEAGEKPADIARRLGIESDQIPSLVRIAREKFQSLSEVD